jgi:hypothetical protein
MPANNGARRRQERRTSAIERQENPPRTIEERLAVAGARERAKLEQTES